MPVTVGEERMVEEACAEFFNFFSERFSVSSGRENLLVHVSPSIHPSPSRREGKIPNKNANERHTQHQLDTFLRRDLFGLLSRKTHTRTQRISVVPSANKNSNAYRQQHTKKVPPPHHHDETTRMRPLQETHRGQVRQRFR